LNYTKTEFNIFKLTLIKMGALTFYSQLARCCVTADTIGRETRIFAFVLREYLVNRESGYSILIFEINDL